MAHPFFNAARYPLHRPEAVAFLEALADSIQIPNQITFIYETCGENLPPLSHGQPRNLMWREALQNLTAVGALQKLIDQIREQFPNSVTMQKVILDVVNAQPGADVPPRPDRDITGALEITQETLKSDQDYAYLLRRFTAILEQISLLSDYKALHDGLHEIQYSFYQNIIGNTKIVMDDKYAKYDLLKYLRDYRRVVTDMQDAAKRKKVESVEDQWIAQLEQAGNDLEEGIKKGNKTQIDSATQTINQVIGTQPTIVNRKLYSAVYAYNGSLPELTDVMNRVCEKLNAIAPASETVKRFKKGIDSLKEMNAKLGALIAEHNTWQDVDNQLRMLPDLLEAGVSVFNKRWQSLRARIEPFYASNDDKSSVRLKEADDLLGAAIVENDSDGVKRAFDNYCSEASDRFFYIDKSVMELCAKLSLSLIR